MAGAGISNVGASSEALDEVEVKGTRLWQLRAEVIKAEDRVVAAYNELNKDDDLDIECLQITPTGTHFSYRYCRTKLQRRAQEDDAASLMAYLRDIDIQFGADGGAPAMTAIAQTRLRLMARQDDYMKNLRKLLQDSPELRNTIKKYDDALRRYEGALEKPRQEQAKPGN